MKVHKLKITPKYYEDVVYGQKRFELRKDDRDYKVGDFVVLQEYSKNEYTGKSIQFNIAYILRNCEEYGLKDGYCILGLR